MDNLKEYEININPYIIQAYCICSRQAWFLSRRINPVQDFSYISIGRTIDKTSYKRKHKSVEIDNMKIDFIEESERGVVICEIKKSSGGKPAAVMQLAYYLYRLKEMGLDAKGKLLIPREKRSETIELTEEIEEKIIEITKNLKNLIKLDTPPEFKKTKYCRTCSYFEFCFT